MTEDAAAYFSEHADEIAELNALDALPDSYVQLLDRFVALVGDGRVLDAGCGHGKDVDYFVEQGLDAVGIDLADGMITYAREHNQGTFQQMDIRDLAFTDETFDGVWCNTVLQFFPPAEQRQVIQELVRVLRPSGILYTTFKLGSEDVVTRDDGLERYLVTRDAAETMLQEQGLRIVEQSTAAVNEMTVLNVFCRK